MPSIVVAPWVAQAASENPLVVIAWATVRMLRVRAHTCDGGFHFDETLGCNTAVHTKKNPI